MQLVSYSGGLIDISALPSLLAWRADMANRLGYPPAITELYRSRAEQLRLYEGWRAGLPGFNPAYHPDNPAARHIHGLAVDWGSGIGYAGSVSGRVAHQTAATHGWEFNVPGERWHAEKVRPSASDKPKPGPLVPIKREFNDMKLRIIKDAASTTKWLVNSDNGRRVPIGSEAHAVVLTRFITNANETMHMGELDTIRQYIQELDKAK